MLVKGDMGSLARSGGGCWLGTGLGAVDPQPHSFPCWEFMFAHADSGLLREQSLGHPTQSSSHAGSSPVPWELPRNARP